MRWPRLTTLSSEPKSLPKGESCLTTLPFSSGSVSRRDRARHNQQLQRRLSSPPTPPLSAVAHPRRLHLLSADYALLAPESAYPLILGELSARRIGILRSNRRAAADWASFATTVVFAVQSWFLAESAVGVVALKREHARDRAREGILWWELSSSAAGTLITLMIIVWSRFSAHSTTFSPVAILLAVGLSILSLAQSLAALILATSTWRVAVGDRCAWSIDPAWTSGLAGRACARAEGQVGTKAWAVATGIRLAVTVIFSTIWIVLLQRFRSRLDDCLGVALPTLDSSALASPTVQNILSRHEAEVQLLHEPPAPPSRLKTGRWPLKRLFPSRFSARGDDDAEKRALRMSPAASSLPSGFSSTQTSPASRSCALFPDQSPLRSPNVADTEADVVRAPSSPLIAVHPCPDDSPRLPRDSSADTLTDSAIYSYRSSLSPSPPPTPTSRFSGFLSPLPSPPPSATAFTSARGDERPPWPPSATGRNERLAYVKMFASHQGGLLVRKLSTIASLNGAFDDAASEGAAGGTTGRRG